MTMRRHYALCSRMQGPMMHARTEVPIKYIQNLKKTVDVSVREPLPINATYSYIPLNDTRTIPQASQSSNLLLLI